MNIGEYFYCSRCLRELDQEGVCGECGYDPSSPIDTDALEEGTLICGKRFQIGAVLQKSRKGYIYGAYDYLKQKPVFLFELFPDPFSARESEGETEVIISAEHQGTFSRMKNKLKDELVSSDRIFEDNNTVYINLYGLNIIPKKNGSDQFPDNQPDLKYDNTVYE